MQKDMQRKEKRKYKKKNYKYLVVPLYNQALVLCSPEGYCQYVKSDEEDPLEGDTAMFKALEGEGANINFIVIGKDGLDPGTIAHESLHASWKILSDVGISPDDGEDQEALTYLLDWIVVQCHKFFL